MPAGGIPLTGIVSASSTHHLRAAVKGKYTQGMLQELEPSKASLTREPIPTQKCCKADGSCHAVLQGMMRPSAMNIAGITGSVKCCRR